MSLINDPNEVKRIVQQAEIVAVVGISKNPNRPSYRIAEQIRDRYTMHYVNPVYAGQKLFGKTIVNSLENIPQHIDIVDVFRNPKYVRSIIEGAIAVNAGVVWLQPGAEDEHLTEAYQDYIDIITHSCLGVVAKYAF
jgi:predicted CoA-binding protein